jgi:hypothetical protein
MLLAADGNPPAALIVVVAGRALARQKGNLAAGIG